MREDVFSSLVVGASFAIALFLVQRYLVPFVAAIREEDPPVRGSLRRQWVAALLVGAVLALVSLLARLLV